MNLPSRGQKWTSKKHIIFQKYAFNVVILNIWQTPLSLNSFHFPLATLMDFCPSKSALLSTYFNVIFPLCYTSQWWAGELSCTKVHEFPYRTVTKEQKPDTLFLHLLSWIFTINQKYFSGSARQTIIGTREVIYGWGR